MNLKTEDPNNADAALAAFLLSDEYERARNDETSEQDFRAVFEHGQLWITQPSTGAIWSVHDAEGPGSIDGYGFEVITVGDEE